MNSKNKGSPPVKSGEILLTEQPFAFVLSSKERGNRCDSCLQVGKLLKCSVCQFVHYCGRSCQKDAWNEHKWECKSLKCISPKVIPDAARLLARIINRLTRGDGNLFRSYYTQKSFRMWKDLMSHYSDLKEDKKRMEHCYSLFGVLTEFLTDVSLPNIIEFMGLYGRMCINSFTILDKNMHSIGTGVYLAASILDHSCIPNAVATFVGKTIIVRSTEDMNFLDWDQVRISYIDLMQKTSDRQSELLKGYYFLCECKRCMDDHLNKLIMGAKCPNMNCDNSVYIPGDYNTDDVIMCSKCKTHTKEADVTKYRRIVDITEEHLQNMKNSNIAYIDVCQYYIKKQEGVLHPFNILYAQTLDYAFDSMIELQMWDGACQYAQRLVPCFSLYYGEKHPLTGILHLKYGKILLYISQAKKAFNHLKIAEKILKVTHGIKHPLYQDDLLPLLRQASMDK